MWTESCVLVMIYKLNLLDLPCRWENTRGVSNSPLLLLHFVLVAGGRRFHAGNSSRPEMHADPFISVQVNISPQ